MKIHNAIKKASYSCAIAVMMMGGVVLTGCQKSASSTPNATDEDKPTSVIVSLSLSSATPMRAAATLPDGNTVVHDQAASIKKVDVYLTDSRGKVLLVKRIDSATEIAQLMKSGNDLNASNQGSRPGIKFLNVDTRVSQVAVVVNPTESPLITGANISEVTVAMPDLADAITSIQIPYASKSPLKIVGSEPWGVDPQNNGENTVVKVADFSVPGMMNRFQVKTKFCRISFRNEAAKHAYEALVQEAVDEVKDLSTSTPVKDKVKEWIGEFDFNTFTSSVGTKGADKSWATFFMVEDITNWNTAAFMNNFYTKVHLFSGFNLDDFYTSGSDAEDDLVSSYVYSYTSFGRLTLDSNNPHLATGWSPDNIDHDKQIPVGAKALYQLPSGLGPDGTSLQKGGKSLAFNFFNGYVKIYDRYDVEWFIKAYKLGPERFLEAPYLHFYFPNASAEHRFVNITSYMNAANNGTRLDDKEMGKGARLLNIDLSEMNNNNGILVESDDPNIKGSGHSDITPSSPFNSIVLVHVKPWEELYGDPVLE